ncbi:MAG: GGDEF domain-containing protein [Treponema sp.]|jgi:diguanylate cyclase (GGDEF)-like protein|nr:GGDEF domain-containing protein [Treponema sp.]
MEKKDMGKLDLPGLSTGEYAALEHIWKLLKDTEIPALSEELADMPFVSDIYREVKALRELAESLRNEINQRNSSVEALQEREFRFRYMASHDSLTGAMNRSSFMKRANRELKSAINQGILCGIIMMDIDFFKKFNDTWGHQAGDEALRHVASVVSRVLRKNDFIGRYGGEEFAFFFNRADLNTGMAIADRAREILMNNPVSLENGPVTITASFGVAMANLALVPDDSGRYLGVLLRHADIALYRAKSTGRNRVVCYSSSEDAVEVSDLGNGI